MIDYVGCNTTRAIRKRDFKAVALNVICWLLVAAVMPALIIWKMGA